MDLSLQLEVGAHAVTAVLGVWLGLTVLVRSGVPGSRVFAVLALSLAAWSSAVIVGRLSSAAAVPGSARAVEEFAAALALAGTAHFSLATATDGHPTRVQRAVIAVAYAVLLAFALPTAIDPSRPVSVTPPHFEAGPVSGALLGWASAASRLVALGLAVTWLVGAIRATGLDGLRRRQLMAALATVLTGGFGAALRILPGIGDADAWIGVSFVSIAVVLATYVVVSGGIFFGPAVAGRAFRTSLVGGLALVVVVALLVTLDGASREHLGLEAPLVTGLGLIVIVALYEPLAGALRRVVGGDGSTGQARARLLRALGQPTLTARSASSGVEPALVRLATALDLTSLAVTEGDGTIIASVGGPVPGDAPSLPLRAANTVLGNLRIGPSRTGAPLGGRHEELLELSASYVAAALLTARHEDEQALELARLAEDRASVDTQASVLHAALAGHQLESQPLRVLALGTLHVERGGARIERWGGEKAGTRQAEALFAFLFDRSERGVAKDEAIELLWPDSDLERADLAFHRTLGGLRATLEPGRSASTGSAIRFVNDRYRLSPSIVGWSDTDAFLKALEHARAEADPKMQLRQLEDARTLYRGDYLDDCPFYGDSAHVESRRAMLRARLVDLLVELGERYEASGDRLSAAGAYREAIERSDEVCPPAEAGLARLQMRST